MSLPIPKRQLNLHAMIALATFVVLIVAGFFLLTAFTGDRGLLKQARAFEKAKQPEQAVSFLTQYLRRHPNNDEALDMRGRLLAETARDPEGRLAAAQDCERALRLKPNLPERQETRRRLAELYLKTARYYTADAVATDLIAGAQDAAAHRLKALALEGEWFQIRGDAKALAPALAEYEKVLQLDPTDINGAARLARLYHDEMKAPAKAERVLDDLLKVNRSAATRLARFNYFAATFQDDRARAELDQALRLAPDDLNVLVAASEEALRRGDAAAGRRYFEQIPATAHTGASVEVLKGLKVLEGLIEFEESRADEAIVSWRKGLRLTAGTDADLSFRLAQILLQLGRIQDADPLIGQYRRLTGGDEPTPRYRYLVALRDFKENRPAQAARELEEIRSKIDAELQAQLNYTLGMAYEATRDEPRALEAYRRAIAAFPKWVTPRLSIARVLQAKDLNAAADELEQDLRDLPEHPVLLVALADVRWLQQLQRPQAQRSWDQINAILERAKRGAPDASQLVTIQADLLASRGQVAEAIKMLEEAARGRDHKNVNLWLSWANGLHRLGRSAEALKVLEEASDPNAAGDQAVLRIARARLLVLRRQSQAAREVLTKDVDRLPRDQQHRIWAALGDLHSDRGERTEARDAYTKWAELDPENPQPRMLLLQVAIAADDDNAVRTNIKALEGIPGPRDTYVRIARAANLLREDRPGMDPKVRAAKLAAAAKEIEAVQTIAPKMAIGYLFEGLLREKQNRIDDAISAYNRALENGSAAVAMPHLVELLTRQRRFDELAMLRPGGASDPRMDRLSAETSLRIGDKDRAEQIAAEVVKANPDALDARVWQAHVLNSVGKPGEAERTLRDLIERHATEPAPWLALLAFQVDQRRPRDVAETIAQIKARVKTDNPELLWAQCYRLTRDAKQAEAMFREALRKWPDDPQVRQTAADFFEAAGKADEAEASLRHVLSRDPSARWAVRKLALLLSARPQDAAAWSEARALMAPNPTGDIPDDRLTRAIVMARGPEPGHRHEAITLLEGLNADLPPKLSAATAVRTLLRQLYLDAGQPEKAAKLAAAAASDRLNADPTAILAYADALLRERKIDEAAKQLERLAELDPNGLDTIRLRARVLLAQERPAEAEIMLDQALQARQKAEAPDTELVGRAAVDLLVEQNQLKAAEQIGRHLAEARPRASWKLAQVLARRDKVDEAFDLCQVAVGAGASRDAALTALTLATRLGAAPAQREKAEAIIASALKDQPEAPDLTLMLAHLHHFQGRFDDEIRLYNKVLDQSPGNYNFLNNMAWTLSEDKNQPAEGLRRVDEAIRHVGRTPLFLDTRGVILTRLGQFDAAIKDLEASAKGTPSGLTLYHLARAYRKAGRDADAVKTFAQAKAAGLKVDQLASDERKEFEQFEQGK